MLKAKTISREYRIYLALWRKALHSPEPVQIMTANFNMAVAMRQGMYRAIRPFRHGEMHDVELLQAADKFVVYLQREKDPDLAHFLVLKERIALAHLEGALDNLGIDEEDLLIGDERVIAESINRIIEQEEKPVAAPNKFYTREG